MAALTFLQFGFLYISILPLVDLEVSCATRLDYIINFVGVKR